jgi:hypothetical protein
MHTGIVMASPAALAASAGHSSSGALAGLCLLARGGAAEGAAAPAVLARAAEVDA